MKNILLAIMILIFGLILVPLGFITYLLVLPFDKNMKVINFVSTLWSWFLIYSHFGSSVKIEGKENIVPKKSYVIVANHNTLYDIPMVHFLKINFRWVSKREVLKIPIFGLVLAMQHSILIRRGDPSSARKMVTRGVELLGRGVSVAVFPEGTRSKDGKVGEFKAGAFIMAKSADVEVLPVILYGSRELLSEKKIRRHKLRLKVLPPMKIEGKVSAFSKELNELYKKELN